MRIFALLFLISCGACKSPDTKPKAEEKKTSQGFSDTFQDENTVLVTSIGRAPNKMAAKNKETFALKEARKKAEYILLRHCHSLCGPFADEPDVIEISHKDFFRQIRVTEMEKQCVEENADLKCKLVLRFESEKLRNRCGKEATEERQRMCDAM